MKIFILLIVIQFASNKRIQPIDYCFDLKGCSKQYHYKCSENLCSKNKLSCQSLKLWGVKVDRFENVNAFKAFEKFFQSIRECPKWNLSDVCLNNGVCFKNILQPHRQWLIGKISIKKKTKCECNGKYSYTCENDLIKDWNYCSIDKGACLRMNSTELAIKECDN